MPHFAMQRNVEFNKALEQSNGIHLMVNQFGKK